MNKSTLNRFSTFLLTALFSNRFAIVFVVVFMFIHEFYVCNKGSIYVHRRICRKSVCSGTRWLLPISEMVHESYDVIPFLDQFVFSILGDIILHTAMVMEIVGRWQNPRTHARPGHRHLLRNRKKAKEKTAIRLFMG